VSCHVVAHARARAPPSTAGAGASTAVPTPTHDSNSQVIGTSRLHNILTLLCRTV
jgi:hypothetical protein